MNRRLFYLLVILLTLVTISKCNADEIVDFRAEGQRLLNNKRRYTQEIQRIDKRLIELNALIDYVQKKQKEKLAKALREGTQEAERIGTEE